MPIKIGKKTFDTFADAVDHIKSVKKLTKEQAQAYVAKIEQTQRRHRKGNRKRK